MNAETRARELLAAQLPNQRKREVLLSGRPATYAGGITATQALRAICSALKIADLNLLSSASLPFLVNDRIPIADKVVVTKCPPNRIKRDQ